MLSPSAIQRADDLVGIEMPMVPLSSACAAPAHANTPNATAVASALILMRYLPSIDSAPWPLVGAKSAAEAETFPPRCGGLLETSVSQSNARSDASYPFLLWVATSAASPSMPQTERPSRPAPPQSRLKLAQLRLVAAIEDGGSVSAAAQVLNLSQPAASRIMAELEA